MRYTLRTVLLLGALTGLLVAVGGAAGGRTGMVVGLVLAGAMNWISYWYSDRIVLKLYRAREVDEHTAPELVAMVRELAQRARLPMPRVYVIESETPNAFATGRDPEHAAVAVTTGIMRILDARELRGVLAHELAHIRNRDILIATVAATVAGAVAILADMLRWAAIFGMGRRDDRGPSGLELLAIAIAAPLIATIIQLAVSRSREFAADAGGAEISRDPLALASALAKIDATVQRYPLEPTPEHQATAHLFIASPFAGDGLLALFRTHPPTEARIARLQELARKLGV